MRIHRCRERAVHASVGRDTDEQDVSNYGSGSATVLGLRLEFDSV